MNLQGRLCSQRRKQGDTGRELQMLRMTDQHNGLDGQTGKSDSEDILKDLKHKRIQLDDLGTRNMEKHSMCYCRDKYQYNSFDTIHRCSVDTI
jgi:hypothetical protein